MPELPELPKHQTDPEAEEDFGFEDQAQNRSLKTLLKRPVTIIAVAILVAIAAGVVWLELERFRGLPTPEVSYGLLPNEGRTTGVPIAIKVNQIAVFMINDPIEGGGANRAQALVDKLQAAMQRAVDNPGLELTLDFASGMPGIVLQNPDGTEREVLVRLTQGDVELAGDTDPKRVARLWAERLTDAIKLTGFAEPPEFTTGTEFGDTLQTLYAEARSRKGRITKAALDNAFEDLPPPQQETLETLPVFNNQAAEPVDESSGQ